MAPELECGTRVADRTSKIIGGSQVSIEEYPWMVALFAENFGKSGNQQYS